MATEKRIAYVRRIPHHTVEAQIEHHRERGIRDRDIWVEGRGAQTLASCARASRPGDTIEVLFFRCLGEHSQQDIREGWAAFHERGVTIVETRTGRHTSADGPALMHDAFARLRSERKAGSKAEMSRRGKKGAKARKKKIQGERMPVDEAYDIWWSGLSWRDALEKINADDRYPRKWTRSTAFRELA